MNITKATVLDPRLRGDVEPPVLMLTTDEPIELPGGLTYVTFGRHRLTATQRGMFFQLDTEDLMVYAEDMVGMVNTSRQVRSKLVTVEVNEPQGMTTLALPIERARRLLRKHELEYQYIASDVAARASRIQWDLECRPMMCVHWFDDSGPCAEPHISEIININGTQLPACRDHTPAMRAKARDLRLQRSTR